MVKITEEKLKEAKCKEILTDEEINYLISKYKNNKTAYINSLNDSACVDEIVIKYNLMFNFDEPLFKYVMKNEQGWEGNYAEVHHPLFVYNKYGQMHYGVADYWYWYEEEQNNIKNAPNSDLWQMIALNKMYELNKLSQDYDILKQKLKELQGGQK